MGKVWLLNSSRLFSEPFSENKKCLEMVSIEIK
jgi:hypothetical protein